MDPSPLPIDDDRHLVIFIPEGEADDYKVESLARIVGISAYDARLSLQSRRPRVFRSVAGVTAARELSEQLATSKIAHYVVAETEVRGLPVSRARQADAFERHLELGLDGTNLSLPYGELLLLVRGEITRARHIEKRMDSTRGASRELSPGLRLHLYSVESSVALEIDPENFDWTVLGIRRTSSSLLNLERFLDLLDERAPGAVLDKGFDLEPAVLSRAEATSDFSQMFSERVEGQDGVLHDNESQFRFYARWRYRLERHLRRSRD